MSNELEWVDSPCPDCGKKRVVQYTDKDENIIHHCDYCQKITVFHRVK